MMTGTDVEEENLDDEPELDAESPLPAAADADADVAVVACVDDGCCYRSLLVDEAETCLLLEYRFVVGQPLIF